MAEIKNLADNHILYNFAKHNNSIPQTSLMAIIEVKTDALQQILGTLMDAMGITSLAIKKRAIAEVRAKIESEKLKKELEHKQNNTIETGRFVCYSGKDITPEMIASAIEIDNTVYSSEYRGDLEQCLKWHQQNPNIYIMIYDNTQNRVVGYINAMPISESVYNKMKGGDMIDVGINTDDIQTCQYPDCYYLYISSIAILPEYRDSHILYRLLNALFEKIIELSDYEIYFKEVLADAVSAEGAKLCTYIGMTPIKSSSHNSTIYTVSLLPPKIQVKTTIGLKFMSVYQEKYNLFKEILDSLQ